jgi:hypothetical protein
MMSQTVLEKFNLLLKEYQVRPASKFQLQPPKPQVHAPVSPLPSSPKAKYTLTKDPFEHVESTRESPRVFKDSNDKIGDRSMDERDRPRHTNKSSSEEAPNMIRSFNFKEYLDKQMNQQIDDAIKVFDHLRNNLPQSKYVKEKLSSRKAFVMQLDASQNAYGEASTGMGLIIDPQFSTDQKALTVKLSYLSDGENQSIDLSLQSSSTILPKSYYLTLSPQIMSIHHDRHLPGWDGILPTFIPTMKCDCEVSCDDQDSLGRDYELSYLLFPVSSTEEIIQSLKRSMESYHIKSLAHAKVMGGMPIVNLAALQGETKVVNLYRQ